MLSGEHKGYPLFKSVAPFWANILILTYFDVKLLPKNNIFIQNEGRNFRKQKSIFGQKSNVRQKSILD